MTLIIIDLGIGNSGSVTAALERVGARPVRTDRPADLAAASAIILPGVGAFGDGMARLRQSGLAGPLVEAVRTRGVPLLGICLGMHLLAERGEEHGRHAGLGLIGGSVVRLDPPPEARLRVPNMGWCDVEVSRPNAILPAASSSFYFAHSYHLVCSDPADVCAVVQYGGPVTAAVARGRIFGVQFHPEKSQDAGLDLLAAFVAIAPAPAGAASR